MDTLNPNRGRRWHTRVNAPIECQLGASSERLPVIDIGVEGLRVRNVERFGIGEVVNVNLFFPDSTQAQCTAKVVWWNALNDESSADYELGLRFMDLSSEAIFHLNSHIKRHQKASSD
jgi:Tfp pilus assembly protein PilZ